MADLSFDNVTPVPASVIPLHDGEDNPHARWWKQQAMAASQEILKLRQKVVALEVDRNYLRGRLAGTRHQVRILQATVADLEEQAGRERDHRPAYLLAAAVWALVMILVWQFSR